MGDYGSKVSDVGYDVKEATDAQLIFSSKFNTVKVIQSGLATLSFPANGTTASSTITLPDAYMGSTIWGIGFADLTATDAGLRFRTNFNISVVSDYFECYISTSSFPVYCLISMERTSSSSTWPGAINIPVKYFVMLI